MKFGITLHFLTALMVALSTRATLAAVAIPIGIGARDNLLAREEPHWATSDEPVRPWGRELEDAEGHKQMGELPFSSFDFFSASQPQRDSNPDDPRRDEKPVKNHRNPEP
ncbi:hypothetical protein NMY22_g2370 [Coprinellus aureogranulatus]|nr:hypothetical protein NMY22_g2370 [Coprinellus aureogranulatus]